MELDDCAKGIAMCFLMIVFVCLLTGVCQPNKQQLSQQDLVSDLITRIENQKAEIDSAEVTEVFKQKTTIHELKSSWIGRPSLIHASGEFKGGAKAMLPRLEMGHCFFSPSKGDLLLVGRKPNGKFTSTSMANYSASLTSLEQILNCKTESELATEIGKDSRPTTGTMYGNRAAWTGTWATFTPNTEGKIDYLLVLAKFEKVNGVEKIRSLRVYSCELEQEKVTEDNERERGHSTFTASTTD